MGKYKRNSKKKITKIVEYKKENGILTKNYPVFETEEEIEAYLIHIRKQHDREAEYIADSLGLIY
jgi:hypothetical protein